MMPAPAVDVRLLSTDAMEVSPEQIRLLAPEEDARFRRFASTQAATHFILGRALLRLTLSTFADVRPADWLFQFGPFGRPEVAGPTPIEVSFSLTHSHRLVGLAITSGAKVGLDIEGGARPFRHDDLAPNVLGPRELQRFKRAGGGCRLFLKYWTLKEAYLKARGDGLNVDLRLIEFDIDAPRPALMPGCQASDPVAQWWFESHEADAEHQLALAVASASPPAVNIRRFRLAAVDGALDLRPYPVTRDVGVEPGVSAPEGAA
jgi:4'-phosphopantetheinyl transferase